MALDNPQHPVPDFVQGSDLLEGALRFTREAYRRGGSRGEAKLRHSVEVARLLHEARFDEEVVAAGLLHDVVEATATELPEIADRFGARTAALVAAMTEDDRIESYEARKAEHRARVAAHGSSAAAIYAADKLAKMPGLRADPDSASQKQLTHYLRTLETLSSQHPDLPFLGDLERELGGVMDERRDRTAGRARAARIQ
jgi:(p)ppGpp synthase/HD superfamily hydrolase